MRIFILPVLGLCAALHGCAGTSEMPPSRKDMTAAGSTTADPDEYHVPDDFFGYAWGTPVSDIPDLKLVPNGVAFAAGYQGKVMDIQMRNCVPAMTGAPAAAPCRINQTVQGAGSYVLASYYREFEPYNPYPGARLAAAVYYFCAGTRGDFVSENIRQHLELCGGDVYFQSEAPEIRRASDPDTNYRRVVDALTARYGRPDNFQYSGHVTVEDEFGTLTLPRMERYGSLYWCKITRHALDPSCKATISLDFDSDSGTGRVLFATAGMYRFAEALHELSEEKIPLYERLHGHPPDRFKSKRRVCTGTHLCGGGTRRLTTQELSYFRPEAGNP